MAHRDNKEKEKTSREATGKYFYTLSQTCFAAMVIVAVLTYFTNKDIPGGNILGLFCVGIAASNYSAPLTRKCQKSALIISKLVLGLFPNSC